MMRKRKREAILRTRRYKVHSEPEKYYHSKLFLYYPWCNEEELITGFDTYQNSYILQNKILYVKMQNISMMNLKYSICVNKMLTTTYHSQHGI